MLPTEIPGHHIEGDVLKVLCGNWDMMIAHPPCTYISNAGARHLYPKGILNASRIKLGWGAKLFFEKLWNAPIRKIVIENPVPSKIFGLPRYDQIIQPYYFGHQIEKKTCLWLKNVAPLISSLICTQAESTKVAGNWFNKGGLDRQKNRSRTFSGIAEAMAEQWGSLK
ncbi:MAG: hypothetical protein Q7T18_11850 [Sedimentisphaerales bacterium]|nr:hypothetical protein [Sedimentisphaerales bacterium]